MKLADLVSTYVAFTRSLGMRFTSDARLLRAFCRAMGAIEVAAVTPEAVRTFLAGTGPVMAYWHLKYQILSSFYRYAIGRGFAAASPLPTTVPICPPALSPYIYSTSSNASGGHRRVAHTQEPVARPGSAPGDSRHLLRAGPSRSPPLADGGHRPPPQSATRHATSPCSGSPRARTKRRSRSPTRPSGRTGGHRRPTSRRQARVWGKRSRK